MTDLRDCWAPLPVCPMVRQIIVRKSTDVLLAVHPPSGRFHALLCRGLDSDVMAEFLRQTKDCFHGDHRIVICNGSGRHIAGDLKVPNEMHVELLPADSPELNPVESVWDYIRDHDFGNRIFARLENVEKSAQVVAPRAAVDAGGGALYLTLHLESERPSWPVGSLPQLWKHQEYGFFPTNNRFSAISSEVSTLLLALACERSPGPKCPRSQNFIQIPTTSGPPPAVPPLHGREPRLPGTPFFSVENWL